MEQKVMLNYNNSKCVASTEWCWEIGKTCFGILIGNSLRTFYIHQIEFEVDTCSYNVKTIVKIFNDFLTLKYFKI